ncbi:hypothetical protein ACM46_20940 [Chryseobacterium angstadtii]|uniref:YD repeat-containing protein n=1 Tax=Chryseobacterium angstadtii TaxID=558151 RepID=A0A0J7I187_9FLAO|nr:RHS repeat domain-containing protein [Chryseobacterium angstadtii]KMQ59546.1 hypothetical protein ACM46_20940 [Chryseobacterium angstadtii]
MQSPDVSTLGKFGNIPISPFTGAALISVPILDVQAGNNKIPISLTYDASGCRPDQRPSVVGLNWSLQAGGAIQRRANGEYDEIYDVYFKTGKWSYIEAGRQLNALDDWKTSWNKNSDRAPDEFVFNFNGITGSFYLDHENKWSVKSKDDPNIKIEVQTTSNYKIDAISNYSVYDGYTLGRTYTGFALTMSNGIKYMFGYDLTAIEFSLPSSPTYLPDEWFTDAPPMANNEGWMTNVQSSAWQLSKILYPEGTSIDFKYKRGYAPYMPLYTEISEGPVGGMAAGSYYTTRINQPGNYMVMSSILTQIKTSQGVTCDFASSLTKDLRWPFKSSYQDFFPIGKVNGECFKIDDITLSSGTTKVKKFSFKYIEKSTERLKLEKIESVTPDGVTVIPYYSFIYNDVKLPAYASGRIDHWGYYNGKNYWMDRTVAPSERYPNQSLYSQYRSPDTALMKAEMIRQVKYPTGGYTNFTFEPHTYSSVVLQSPKISLKKNATNAFAGGMRLRKTEDFDGISSKPNVTEYFYTKDYLGNGTLSSGVLNGEPVYYEEGSGLQGQPYKRFSSLSLSYLNNSNGSHVTYSEVTEKTMGGYRIRKYSNSDNGYLDKDPFAQFLNQSQSSRYEQKLISSVDLERGLILSEQIFDDKKKKIQKTDYKYNIDALRYNKYVRTMRNVGPPTLAAISNVSLPIYTFVPYLTSNLVTTYGLSGDSTILRKELSYNSLNLLQKIKSYDPRDFINETVYKYPWDYTLPSATNNITTNIVSMRNANMLALPVEVFSIVDKSGSRNIEGSSYFQYMKGKINTIYKTALSKPQSEATFKGAYTDSDQVFKLNPELRLEQDISIMDVYGNPLMIQINKEPSICYIWGNNGQYLLAEVKNVVYNDMVKALGGAAIVTQLNNPTTTETVVTDKIKALRIALPDAEITSFTYKPLIGILSKTDPKGMVESYDYDSFGRLAAIKDNSGNIIKTFCYNYRNQPIDCNGQRKIPINAAAVSLAYMQRINGSGTSLCESLNRSEYYILNPLDQPDPPIIVGTILCNLDGTRASSGFYSRGLSIAYVGTNGTVESIHQCSDQWGEIEL